MPTTHRSRASALAKAGPLVVALLATVLVAPLVSAADSAPITLATADGPTLKLGDVASDDDLVGVVYQLGTRSYLRWSTNEGESFVPRTALRGGLRARDPRVAVCHDVVFAVASWQTSTARLVGVDYRNVATGENGRYSLGEGTLADIACFGEVAAITWVHNDHAWLAVHEGPCGSPCVPDVKLDLGTGDFASPPRITGHGEGFTATWVTTGLAVQQFIYGAASGGGFDIAPGPVLTLMAGHDIDVPAIGGLGPRVAVAYERNGETHLRVSHDMGASFGGRIVVSRFCPSCAEGVQSPMPESVAVRSDDILVEVRRVYGSPYSYETNAFLSRDYGTSWAKVSTRSGGLQRGILITSGTFAEVWDRHFYDAYPYPATDQLIGFQVKSL